MVREISGILSDCEPSIYMYGSSALVEPCEKYLQSYIEAYDEYKLNDVQTYAFDDARV